MVFYLYALTDTLVDVSDLRGVAGETLTVVPLAEAVAIGGWLDAVPAIDRASLSAQDHVVRALHERATALLPMRFGSAVSDVDAAVRAVEVMGVGLGARFDTVRGREQMTLRVFHAAGVPELQGSKGAESDHRAASAEPAVEEGKDGPGTRYLRARALTQAPREVVPLLDALEPLQRATSIEPARHALLVATIYQLIDRGTSERYRAAAEAAAATIVPLSVRISGPSPAYAFAR